MSSRLSGQARRWAMLSSAILTCAAFIASAADESVAPPKFYAQWKNGPRADESFFPIGVWLQNPSNAKRFQALGINLYVGLYRGPTSNQLAQLQEAGMSVICSQGRGLQFKNNPTIVGWMHGDEPDNAQSLGQGKGYGPPILPEKIVRDYERLRAADPTRPIFLNLGQGVAWDNWIGRGVRRNHPEDYPEYVKGSDIASFDIYPVVHDNREVAGKLEFVAKGAERLKKWAGPNRLTWTCIECTRISNTNRKASPFQVRSEVWMALIHGSQGLVYFVHQFKPVFREAALLDDPEMATTVTEINRQIHELAPVLNSPSIDAATVTSSNPDAPIAWMTKRRKGVNYIFAVNMANEPATGSFQLRRDFRAARAEVLGEDRRIVVDDGRFNDRFNGYGVHLYRFAE